MWTHFYHFSTTVVWSRGKSPTSPSSPERSVAREQNAARQCRDWRRVTFGASNCAMDTMNVVIYMWFTWIFTGGLVVPMMVWNSWTQISQVCRANAWIRGLLVLKLRTICLHQACSQSNGGFLEVNLEYSPGSKACMQHVFNKIWGPRIWREVRSLNDNKGILRANNTHMRPQVAQRRRLGVFVCLCLRFLWTTMDSVMLRPCEVANSLPIPLAAAGAPRIWENLGEPAPLPGDLRFWRLLQTVLTSLLCRGLNFRWCQTCCYLEIPNRLGVLKAQSHCADSDI